MDQIPKSWTFLGEQIHQDFLIDYPDFWSGVVEIFAGLDAKERQELIRFIHRGIAKEKEKPGMLKKLWFRSGAQVGFQSKNPVAFYLEMAGRFESVASG